MPHAPLTRPEYWDKYKPHKGDGEQLAPAIGRFDWTQYDGHGPGAEILGRPRTALELGPAEGKEAAHLAFQGTVVTGIDFSPVQVDRARALWHNTPRLDFHHGEACDYLSTTPSRWDAIYSVWGAVWFTDPDDLFPHVLKALTPGGVFAFSQAEPSADVHGPQQMHGKWLEGRERELTVLRWQYHPDTWADILKRHGFIDVDARIIGAPTAGKLGTLLVRAYAPS
ncbi:class I SAM-dependent methyltransferase [Streptomyces sp. NPDC050738]|uniref:class I SAM-dependent methyltransferase n=1 Tax=Streptomyces sp. NPDC050738 TaxID=3154744 RepID=UPI0034495045